MGGSQHGVYFLLETGWRIPPAPPRPFVRVPTDRGLSTQITLTGLSLVFINFLTMLYYDPYYYTAKHADGPPNWIYFTYGFS